MGTGENLTASERVQRLQTALHAKAKEAPDFRFYSLSDKVWRDDVLAVAWQAVRRNGGAAGVDGATVADVESFGVDRWLEALARDLKAGTYRPQPVRQVLIPKKQRGKFRPLGIPCLRDRVAQTAAMLVLSPVFEADLQPEQYAYRSGRHAHDAVNRVHRLLNAGHREVVDADLSDYFGQIPHAALMQSIARRVSDGRLLGWVKAWLEMAVEEDDGHGGRRRTNRARRERKGTPQGAPITPRTQKVTSMVRAVTGAAARFAGVRWRRPRGNWNAVSDHDRVVADEHFLDDEAHDSLLLDDVERLGRRAQAREERRQSLRQAQMGGTITGLLDQRAQFLAQRLLALTQQRHALA